MSMANNINFRELSDGSIQLRLRVLSGKEGFRPDAERNAPISLEVTENLDHQMPQVEFKAGLVIGKDPETGKNMYRTYNIVFLGQKACDYIMQMHGKRAFRRGTPIAVDVIAISEGLSAFEDGTVKSWYRAYVLINNGGMYDGLPRNFSVDQAFSLTEGMFAKTDNGDLFENEINASSGAGFITQPETIATTQKTQVESFNALFGEDETKLPHSDSTVTTEKKGRGRIGAK